MIVLHFRYLSRCIRPLLLEKFVNISLHAIEKIKRLTMFVSYSSWFDTYFSIRWNDPVTLTFVHCTVRLINRSTIQEIRWKKKEERWVGCSLISYFAFNSNSFLSSGFLRARFLRVVQMKILHKEMDIYSFLKRTSFNTTNCSGFILANF